MLKVIMNWSVQIFVFTSLQWPFSPPKENWEITHFQSCFIQQYPPGLPCIFQFFANLCSSAGRTLVETHYPMEWKLQASTLTQLDIILIHPEHSDCGSVLTQLLNTLTSHTAYFSLHSQSHTSIFGLWDYIYLYKLFLSNCSELSLCFNYFYCMKMFHFH